MRLTHNLSNDVFIINNITNRPIHVECTTMRNVLASAMETYLGALFSNCQRGAATRMALMEMGHAQTPTP